MPPQTAAHGERNNDEEDFVPQIAERSWDGGPPMKWAIWTNDRRGSRSKSDSEEEVEVLPPNFLYEEFPKRN